MNLDKSVDIACIKCHEEWVSLGARLLDTLPNPLKPLQAHRAPSYLEALAHDKEIEKMIQRRVKQGREYVLLACQEIISPLSMVPFFSQNEAMKRGGLYDEMTRLATSCNLRILLRRKNQTSRYLENQPSFLCETHFPVGTILKDIFFEEVVSDQEELFQLVCIEECDDEVYQFLHALRSLAPGASMLFTLRSLRSEVSALIIFFALKIFKAKVTIICPETGGRVTEKVYIACSGANEKSLDKNIAACSKARAMLTKVGPGYIENLVPENLLASITYWGLLVLAEVQKKQATALRLCATILRHKPLVSRRQLHSLLCVCIDAAEKSGALDRIRNMFAPGCRLPDTTQTAHVTGCEVNIETLCSSLMMFLED